MSSVVRVDTDGVPTYRPPAVNPQYIPTAVNPQYIPTAVNPQYIPTAPQHFGRTQVQLQRLALKTLAGVGALAGTFAAIKGDAERIFTVPLLLGFVGGCLYVASNVKDYEDPDELRAMQENAAIQTFPAIIKEHSLENTVKYLLNADVVKLKFKEAYGLSKLSRLLQIYPFAIIRKYKLADDALLQRCFFNQLREASVWELEESFVTMCRIEGVISEVGSKALIDFICQVKSCETNYSARCADLDTKYPGRTSKLLKELDLKAKALPGEAEKMKNTILQNGYRAANEQAEVRLVLDTFLTGKSAMECLGNYVDTTVQGSVVAQATAAKTEQQWLEQQLTAIETKRQHILEKNFGGEQETLYQQALKILESDRRGTLWQLQSKFYEKIFELFGDI